MIFSSPEFCLLFLPITVILYYALLRFRYNYFIAPFLFIASLIYYAWWRPENIWIILLSITGNYVLGQMMVQAVTCRKAILILGLIGNLCALAWYKYTNFALETLNSLLHADLPLQEIILPIGISFFTFQQIAYLSDIYTQKHDPSHEGFINYCCFICFFPQLVAGPIVHHREMMPQFFDSCNHQVQWENIFNGLVIFSIGLAKKLLIADNLSPIARHCFDVTGSMTFLEAGFGSIAYTLQLYFDFSGYSDMAVGSALLFNIHLPWNFNSPYKASNIQDFWRRWHITLSRWLRDYLYIPLGGNRRGASRTLGNLFITFLLGGLWHGAAWTFVIWGAMHGAALALHRLWSQSGRALSPLLGWMLTFIFVNAAWIVFRAPTMERLGKFVDAFLGYNGFAFRKSFREAVITSTQFSSFSAVALLVLGCLLVVLAFPNSISWQKMKPQYRLWLAVLLSCLSLLALILPQAHPEFIYSQF